MHRALQTIFEHWELMSQIAQYVSKQSMRSFALYTSGKDTKIFSETIVLRSFDTSMGYLNVVDQISTKVINTAEKHIGSFYAPVVYIVHYIRGSRSKSMHMKYSRDSSHKKQHAVVVTLSMVDILLSAF